ncbi:MAG: class I SAM-dependent methyltransferase [Candidatus Eisenbacteria bacterium]|nr:class I SAM-dependent methyltransferase [Candidatus Eisenbacteria bacterium]
MSDPSAERADVDTASDDYATRFAGGVGRWFLAEQARATRALLADLPGGATVLDVGGGHAQLTPMLLEAGYDVTVVGSGPGADRQLRPFIARGAVRFATGDLVALPYPDRSFDAAISFRLLPHVTRWRELVAELCRVARRAVVADYPSQRSLNAIGGGLFGVKKGIEKNTRTYTLFAPAEIDAAFAANGWRVTRARPQFLWPMVLHRVLKSAALAGALEAPPRRLGLTRAFGSPVIVRAERRD